LERIGSVDLASVQAVAGALAAAPRTLAVVGPFDRDHFAGF